MLATKSPTDPPLSRSALLSYAAPVLPILFLFGPIGVLQGVYAKYFGLPLTTIAAVLVIARLFDAVTDPLIGYAVDRYCSRGGSRKLFLASGFILLMVASWFLYIPPEDVSLGYFLGWYLAFYFAYTLFEIPHISWASKLTASAQCRSTLFNLRAVATIVGSLLFYLVPQLPLFETSEITPETLSWTVCLAYLVMLPSMYACLVNVPNENLENSAPETAVLKDSPGFLLRSVRANKPLMVLLFSCACMFFAGGMSSMLLFLFVDVYLGLGEKFTLIFMISFGGSLVFLKGWHYLSHYCGMQILWLVGSVIMVAGSVGTGLLSPDADWRWLLFWMVLTMGGGSVFAIAMPVLMSSIADYGTWKFGIDRTATYFSLQAFLNKAVSAIGGSFGLAIADWYGFDPTATVFSEAAVFGLRLSIVWIPIFILLAGAVMVLRIPITGRQHKVIRHRLIQRSAAPSSKITAQQR